MRKKIKENKKRNKRVKKRIFFPLPSGEQALLVRKSTFHTKYILLCNLGLFEERT
jgi:hypothetical protein